MLTQTTEIRWFWPTMKRQVEYDWFWGRNRRQAEQRTDRYLLLPGCRTTGIKHREGRLEIKTLQDKDPPEDYPGRWHGSLQRWLKWSIEGFQEPALKQANERWLAISKQRCQRRFSFKHNQYVELEAGAPLTNMEYRVELTLVTIEECDDRWLTFSFEANGETTFAEKALERIFSKYFSPNPFSTETVAALSYPAWLMEYYG